MVVVFTNSKGEVDFVILTSLYYGLSRVDKPILEYSKNMDLKGAHRICICGHGSPGEIESTSAQEVADTLAHPTTGCKDTLSELLINSCYAGCTVGSKPGTAVIDVICQTLQIRDLVIKGAMGPSIKANVLGDMFRVVNEAVDPDADQASDLQTDMVKTSVDLQTNKLGTSQGKSQKTALKSIKDIPAQARFCDQVSRKFFEDFVKGLEKLPGELFDKSLAMRSVYWDGSKVVEGKPKSGLHTGVSISFAAMREMRWLPQNV